MKNLFTAFITLIFFTSFQISTHALPPVPQSEIIHSFETQQQLTSPFDVFMKRDNNEGVWTAIIILMTLGLIGLQVYFLIQGGLAMIISLLLLLPIIIMFISMSFSSIIDK